MSDDQPLKLPWIKNDTGRPLNRKWIRLKKRSPRAALAVSDAWCMSGGQGTRGYVPDEWADILGLTSPVVKVLEEDGWLHRNGDGWHIHEWEVHQEEAERIALKRVKDAARKRDERSS